MIISSRAAAAAAMTTAATTMPMPMRVTAMTTQSMVIPGANAVLILGVLPQVLVEDEAMGM